MRPLPAPHPVFAALVLALAAALAGAPAALAKGGPTGAIPLPPPPPAPASIKPIAPIAPTATARQGLTVDVFAMGQADAMLIVGPSASVLVDCGSPVDGGPLDAHVKVAAAIRSRTGGSRVDYLILTHFHEDHTGLPGRPDTGLWGLIAEGISIGTWLDHGDQYPWFGEETFPHRELLRALPTWRTTGALQMRRVPRVGEEIALGGGAALRFVAVNGNGVLQRAAAAGRYNGRPAPSENDYSLAFVLRSGSFEMFSGGDLSGEATPPRRSGSNDVYEDVESTVAAAVGNVEVLRVNHHGSPHSTNDRFATALRPEAAIVSCGERNPFGHPSRGVVRRIQKFAPVFATSGLASKWRREPNPPAVEGDITILVTPDGSRYKVLGDSGLLLDARSFSDAEEAAGADHPRPTP